METKGVASHRAPVSTLNAHRTGDEISHDAFVTALREEFAATYPGTMPVTVVEEKDVDLPKVWDDVADIKVSWRNAPNADIQSWEWQYGQTPEFTNLITADLSFGRVVGFPNTPRFSEVLTHPRRRMSTRATHSSSRSCSNCTRSTRRRAMRRRTRWTASASRSRARGTRPSRAPRPSWATRCAPISQARCSRGSVGPCEDERYTAI